MKKITIVTLFAALCFTTGFTCSKNAPVAEKTTESTTGVDQSQMATPPADGAATAPATPEGQPAATESAPSAPPAETQPAK